MSDFKGFRDSRMRTLTEAELNPDQRGYYDKIVKISRGGLNGPMNVMMRSPKFAHAKNAVGEFVKLPEAGVEPRVQELGILVIARYWSADYEWWVHVPKAIALGIPREAIEDIRARRTPRGLSPDDHVIWDFLHTLLHERKVSDELYDAAKAILGEAPLIHFLGLVGSYALLGIILNATETHTPGVPADELEILYPE